MPEPSRFLAAFVAGLSMACACTAHAQSVNRFPQRICDVREHGAKGTRIWFDTRAFQSAIDACAAAGGGTVLVPRGEWLKATGFPIGATAFLSTDQRGDITLRRMGVSVPRRLRVVKAKT